MSVPAEFATLAQRVWALEGNEYVYVEQMDVFRVRISDVTEREDGQGFHAQATALPTPGLPVSKRPSWRFGGAWAYVESTAGVISCPVVRWRVLTSAAALTELLQILSRVPPGQTYRHGATRRPAPAGLPVIAIVTPGPIWMEVRDFIKAQV